MVKVAYDAGHGKFTAGKRSPFDEREWMFNNEVAVAFANRMNQYENVQLLRLDDPKGMRDVPLHERTDKANEWHADVLISFHHNALGGVWHSGGGVETFVHPQSSKKSKELQKLIHPAIVKAMGLKDRGMKEQNLHMLRESNMPSILTEGGFMDSTADIVVMRDKNRLKAQGEAVADAVAKYFGLKLKQVVKAANTQKEEIRMLKPSTKTLENEFATLLETAHKEGILSSPEWAKKAREGNLSLDDAIALQSTIIRRVHFNK